MFLIVLQSQAGDRVSHKVTVQKLPMNQVLNSQSGIDFYEKKTTIINTQNMICHNDKKITFKQVKSLHSDTEFNYTRIKNTSFKVIHTSALQNSYPQKNLIVTITDL